MLDRIIDNIEQSCCCKVKPDQKIGDIVEDSLELLHIISELEDEFEVNLPTRDMTPREFQTEILKQRPELI